MSGYAELTALSVDELRARARLPFRLVEDIPTLMADFACAIADEIQAANRDGRPARLILPVGPVKQYPMLVEITNRERIDWRNARADLYQDFAIGIRCVTDTPSTRLP